VKRKTKAIEDKASRLGEGTVTGFPQAGEEMVAIRMRPGRAALIDGVRREAGSLVRAPAGQAQRLVDAGYAEYVEAGHESV
jgi:hypothetical protein